MEREFKKAYAALNAQQRQAVDAIDGPVLVVAGPGTGKTQLLSARIANILKTTDTLPGNILALTFTNKAAVNMRERIIDLAGAAGARVAASTFHSFAAEIMNLYPDHFWNAARLGVAPESVQLDAIESIIAGLPLDNPLALRFAGQYTLIKDVRSAINLTKEAGLTPDKLRAIINANLAYIDLIEVDFAEVCGQKLSAKNLDELAAKISELPVQEIDRFLYPLRSLSGVINDSLAAAIEADSGSGKSTKTSRWKSRWLQNVDGQKTMGHERERNNWWLNIADVYDSYRNELHGRGFYDYADMLVEVIAQLEQNSAMLADVQERFNYVLIDEFQDTNPAQLRLAHLVADHYTAGGRPNLMAVGDDDQSIFKFNGAELNNMLNFKQNYKDAQVIVLTENYRSTQAILDTAEKIISQASARLVESEPSYSKRLVAAAPPQPAGEIAAKAYASSELQYSEVARDIQKKYKPEREIAVLARSHDSLIRMAGLLSQLGVPVRYEQASNILDHEIVKQSYLSVKLLLAIQDGDRQTGNAMIQQMLRWPAWGIAPAELWRLAADNYPAGDWLSSMLTSKNAGLKILSEFFIDLAQIAQSQPLAVTVEQILGLRDGPNFTSPIKNYFTAGAQVDVGSYFHGLSAIQLLRSLVHEFSRGAAPALTDLARFFEINQLNGLVVADESPFVTGLNAVQLLTVHKSKGLEFDDVYIIDAVDNNWRPRAGGRKPPANLPLQPVGDDFDDYVRLMYVAATRAKASLTLSGYYQDHAGKAVEMSPIVQSAFDIERVDQTDQAQLITVLEQNLHWPDLSGGDEKLILQSRLQNYNLYVTHLLNFLDISKGGPQYFKERNLLSLPEVKSASLSYGTAIHAALDNAQKLVNRGDFSLSKVDTSFADALAAEQLPAAEFERYRAQGKRELARLFNELGYKMPKGSISEQKLRDVFLGQALIGGTLDRVDNDDGHICITDYKTGRPLASFDTKDKNQALKAYKHKLQLIFYAILMRQHGGPKPKSIEGQIVYVEAQNSKELVRSYTPTDADIDRLSRLIQKVYARIINLDLPDVSAYPPDFSGVIEFENDLLK